MHYAYIFSNDGTEGFGHEVPVILKIANGKQVRVAVLPVPASGRLQ